MNYLSTVAIKCEEKAFEMFKEVYAECGLMPDRIYEEDEFKIIFFDWMVWNRRAKDIEVIIILMDYLDTELFFDRDGYRYSCMRIGEELGDIEKRSNGMEDEFKLEYKIEINLDHAKDITDDSLLS